MVSMRSITTLLIGLLIAASTVSGAAEHAAVDYDHRHYRASGGATPIDCADVLTPAPGALASPTAIANEYATQFGGACLSLREGATIIDVRVGDVTGRAVSFGYELVDADGAVLASADACRFVAGIEIPTDATALLVRVDAVPKGACDSAGVAGQITMVSYTPLALHAP